jgi:DHA2 family multidrug resistance protein
MSADTPTRAAAGKWTVAFSVLSGTFMAVMDVSVVNVALPHMMGTFAQDLNAITWVATVYAIGQIITSTMAGWLATLIGRKRLVLSAFAVFIVGSVLAGTARTFPEMMVYRAIQGMGGGCLIPVCQAIMREAFPAAEQGMAMAIYGMGVVLAPAIGPIFGGWLTDNYGWPWIFYINLPICAFGMLMVSAFVQDPPYLKRGVSRIDGLGIVLLATGLTAMQMVLEHGQQLNWFQSDFIIGGTAVSVVTLTALVFWELHVDEPIVNLRLLKDIPLAAGCAIGLVFGIGLFGTTFILPQFTQTVLGYPAYQSGLVLFPRAVILFLAMPVVGWLYKYFDARLLVAVGIGFICWTFVDLYGLSLDADFWAMSRPLLLMGIGMPFLFVTMTAISLSSIAKKDMTEASSIYTMTRAVGGNIGYALVATLIANYTQIHRAMLAKNITSLNPAFRAMQDGISGYVFRHGIDRVDASHAAMAIINAQLQRQSTMLAYNDVSLVLGGLFVATIPLLIFMPGRHPLDPEAGRTILSE